jgi:Mn2+/Fe2+ NRAMP family transporter
MMFEIAIQDSDARKLTPHLEVPLYELGQKMSICFHVSSRTVSQILYEMTNAPDFWVTLDQWETSIQVTWSHLTNQRPGKYSRLLRTTATCISWLWPLNYFYIASNLSHTCRNESYKVNMWWKFKSTQAAVIIVILSVLLLFMQLVTCTRHSYSTHGCTDV